MNYIYWLSEAQMGRLGPYFPKSQGRARIDDRRVLSGVVFINRNGMHDGSGRWPGKTSTGRFKT